VHGNSAPHRPARNILCNQPNLQPSQTLSSTPNRRDVFGKTLQHYRREGHYKLHDYVVMPDHIHLLLTPNGRSIERVMGLIKGGFSHRLNSSFPVWQRGFTDRRVRDKEEFLTRRNYIYQNPVRARLVERAEEYRFSSAFRGGREESEPGD
jgi:putative transposase